MGRGKAILLGAKAKPLIGPRVQIDEHVSWSVVPICIPHVQLDGELEIEVWFIDGTSYKLPLNQTVKVMCQFIRVSILKEISNTKRVSVVLEEIN